MNFISISSPALNSYGATVFSVDLRYDLRSSCKPRWCNRPLVVCVNRVHKGLIAGLSSSCRDSGTLVVRILAFNLGKPGSIPNEVAPGFSQGVIVLDDVAGWRFFQGSPFPPSFHYGTAPYSPRSYHVGSQDLNVKSLLNLFTHSLASQKQPSDAHKTPNDQMKRCQERKNNIEASERVNVYVFSQNKRQCPLHSHTPFLRVKTALAFLMYATGCLRVLKERGGYGDTFYGLYDFVEGKLSLSPRDFSELTTRNTALHAIPALNWSSPDLSPIEHLWDELDRRVRARQARPKSITQLTEWLQEEWRRIPVDALQTLVESMPDRVAAVIATRACSPPTKANRVQSWPGHRIFSSGNRAGRCRRSAGFLDDLPFPPPFHSAAPPYSPQSSSSALKTSLLTAAQISPLTHSLINTKLLHMSSIETSDADLAPREWGHSKGWSSHTSHYTLHCDVAISRARIDLHVFRGALLQLALN
ncbi:hypothetical protein PR048_015665 [Dryococelus australis]|uniref:Uncharacterized protein n=1 Tax=Dryococelus australis TaxID=614101 RepID=A0ABQ9HHW2_9NEOP|nr:hypothetical protein PR048_015665 [Dryococelus australis]